MSKLHELLGRLDTPKRNIFEMPKAARDEVIDPAPTAGIELESLPETETNLIPIASGKGGVGKTNLSVNLSIALADRVRDRNPGGRVVLIDCDFGLPNADILLQARVERTIEDFVSKKAMSLAEVVTPTGFPGLFFLSGATTPSMTLSNLYYQQRQKFLRNIKSLRADYVILDLGASVHFEVLDFFAMVNSGVIVTNPEPTALRDSYLFMRASLHRKIRRDACEWPVIIRHLDELESDGAAIPSIPGMLSQILRDGDAIEAKALKAIMDSFVPKIIINRAESFDEGTLAARSIRDQARRELGADISYLGPVLQDKCVVRAVKESVPFIRRYPECGASQWVKSLADKIMENSDFGIERNYFSFGGYIRRLFAGKGESVIPKISTAAG